MSSPPIHFFLLTLALLTTLTNPHFFHNFCEPTNYNIPSSTHNFCEATNYYTPSTSSTYKTNLNLLFSSLILNTPKTGFSTAIEGEPPYQVYGLALCRGDIDQDTCTSCLNSASQSIIQLCPYPNGGIVWYNNCGVRYSIHNFFSQFPTAKDYFASCQQMAVSKPFEFKQLVISLMESISEIAAFNASVKMFVTSVNARAYGMVQCTRDLSESDCFKCLNQTFYTLFEVCGASSSGVAVKWSCRVAYSSHIYHNSDRIELSPAPSIPFLVSSTDLKSCK